MKTNQTTTYRGHTLLLLSFTFTVLMFSSLAVNAQRGEETDQRQEEAILPDLKVQFTGEQIKTYMRNYENYIAESGARASRTNVVIPRKVASQIKAQQKGSWFGVTPPDEMDRSEVRFGLKIAGNTQTTGQEVYYIVVPVDADGNILENKGKNPIYLGVQARGTGDCPPFCD